MIISGSKDQLQSKVLPVDQRNISSLRVLDFLGHFLLAFGTLPPHLGDPNWNLKNIIFEVIIRDHKLCFQIMLRRNHVCSLIKLKNIWLKELSEAVTGRVL